MYALARENVSLVHFKPSCRANAERAPLLAGSRSHHPIVHTPTEFIMTQQLILNIQRTQFYAEGEAMDAGRLLFCIHTRGCLPSLMYCD
jgi:hypothetical protein